MMLNNFWLVLMEMNRKMMTLDEAIQHALEVAKKSDCEDCAKNHRQLADWLIDLKTFRKEETNHDEKTEALPFLWL